MAYEVTEFGLLLSFRMEGNANLQIAFSENKDEAFFSTSNFIASKSKVSVALRVINSKVRP